jgi:hypothetical protein
VSGDGGGVSAAGMRGIAGEQVPGVIIFTRTRARNRASNRVGDGGGEVGESWKAQVKTRPPRRSASPDRSAPRAPDSGPREGRPAWWRVEHRPCGRGTALALASAATCGQAQSRGQSSSPTQRRGQARTMSAWGRDFVGTRWGPTPASVKRDPGHGIAQGTWRLVRRRRGGVSAAPVRGIAGEQFPGVIISIRTKARIGPEPCR